MINRKLTIVLIGLFLFGLVAPLNAKMPKEQVYPLFSQANQSFHEANAAKDTEQAKKLYEKAILAFERIVDEGQVKNARLYYNLGNAYFLKGDIGKALLNYRRAEKLDNSDTNIQKNLAFALDKRIDKIETKTEKRILQMLFFWHYDFSVKTRFLLACIFFGVVCICFAGAIWFGRSASWVAPAIICSFLTICFLLSLVIEYRTQANRISGVITAKEVIAYQGDGTNYSPSFKDSLHEGTEFDLLESRPGWLHIKLFDNSDGWISQASAELI
jgi:tetratricopeptide (TPR) repeat protein